MTTQEAFIQQILAEPDRDDIRLIYADYLQENGQEARAEFIRLQIHLAREFGGELVCRRTGEVHRGYGKYTPHCRCTPCKLKRREYMVSRRHIHVDWFRECVGIPNGLRRGFVERIECSLRDLVRLGRKTVRNQPVTTLAFLYQEPLVTLEGKYHWVRGINGAPEWFPEFRRELVPSAFFDAYPALGQFFASEEEAMDALSLAGLAWARINYSSPTAQ